MQNYAGWLRTRRQILGLTQRDLSERSGVKQPLISAVESGRRSASSGVQTALGQVLAVKPSWALSYFRDQARQVVQRNRGVEAAVFGSVAHGEDSPNSDLDLLVRFEPDADITDLLALKEELSELLTVPVDVVSAGSSTGLAIHTRAEAVPL
jgi:predicted nucleotidyltransferase